MAIQSSHAHRRWRRIFVWSLIVFVSLLGVVALIAQLTVAPQIKSQLLAAVEDHLHARLSIGKIRYHIPFTVQLYDIHLIAHPEHPAGGEELFSAERITLSLAKLPIGHGPVMIQRLAVINPVMHVTREIDGSIVGLDLLRPTTEPIHPRGPLKLSDLLRLQRFMLRNGTIAYQDRAAGSSTTEWTQLDSDMLLTQHSASLYGIRLSATDSSIAHGSVVGTIDVDSLQLNLSRVAASVISNHPEVLPNPDPLPPQVRYLIHRFNVAGVIAMEGSADIPLRTPEKTTFATDLSLHDAKAKLPDKLRLDDLTIRLHGDSNGKGATTRPINLSLEQFDAAAGGAKFHLQPTTARFNLREKQWSLNGITGTFDSPVDAKTPAPWNLTGHADFHTDLVPKAGGGLAAALGSLQLKDLYFQPPDLPQAISKFSGQAELAAASGENASPLGTIVLRDASLSYGKDLWTLNHAEIPLSPLPGRIQLNHIDAQMRFAVPAMHYPGDFGDVLDQLLPGGPFTLRGIGAAQWVSNPTPHYSPLWELTIRPEDPVLQGVSQSSLTLLDGRLPVTQIIGELLLTKHAFDLHHLTGKALGGDLTLSVNARVAEPLTYQGKLDLTHGSIEQAAALAADPKSSDSLPKGDAHLTLDFFSRPPQDLLPSTAASDPDNATMQQLVDILGGDGRLHVVNGDLWSSPVLTRLTSKIKLAKEAFTVGEGGGIFSIENRAVHIKHGALNTPAIGLEGSGTVTFSRQLDITVIAAPLGDWRRDLRKTDIPIVSGALAEVAGVLQSAVNGAQELLYQFHVTGPSENPKIAAIPTPFLTEPTAKLFAYMLHPDGQTQLMDAVASPPPTTAPATQR